MFCILTKVPIEKKEKAMAASTADFLDICISLRFSVFLHVSVR
jgi:hypothetical protein